MTLSLNWTEALFLPMAAQLAAIAAFLLLTRENRLTNRLMAAWLLAVTGLIIPYVLTHAGAYDRYSLLWFVPFSLPLLMGPILLAFVRSYTTGRPPEGMALHLAPAVADAAYQLFCWAQPQTWKVQWAAVHLPIVKPAIGAAGLASLIVYLCWALALLRRYRCRGPAQLRARRRQATSWLQRVLMLLLALMSLRAAVQIMDAFTPLVGHAQRFGFYLLLTVLSLYAALESWRRARDALPATEMSVADAEADMKLRWHALGTRWAVSVREAEYWRDPELSLSSLASRLGTNTNDLSRALNEGLGIGFSTFLNGLRLEQVAAELRRPGSKSLLTIAMECGFNSKATFNRAFRARFGVPPSQFRRQAAAAVCARNDGESAGLSTGGAIALPAAR